jgi:site-specific recombinase XerD
MSRNTIGKMVRKYVKRAGLNGVSSRTLRHTMATHYLAKGGDLHATKERLGLESLKQMRV